MPPVGLSGINNISKPGDANEVLYDKLTGTSKQAKVPGSAFLPARTSSRTKEDAADVEDPAPRPLIQPTITGYLFFKGLRSDAAKEAVVSTPCRHT